MFPNRMFELSDYVDTCRYVCVNGHNFGFAVAAESKPFYVNVLVPWFSTCKTEITFPYLIKLLQISISVYEMHDVMVIRTAWENREKMLAL